MRQVYVRRRKERVHVIMLVHNMFACVCVRVKLRGAMC